MILQRKITSRVQINKGEWHVEWEEWTDCQCMKVKRSLTMLQERMPLLKDLPLF